MFILILESLETFLNASQPADIREKKMIKEFRHPMRHKLSMEVKDSAFAMLVHPKGAFVSHGITPN